ncbi:MAG: hypothetical protein Q4E72_05490 [bacterium]|nr:hypothetical protein [bacterium]
MKSSEHHGKAKPWLLALIMAIAPLTGCGADNADFAQTEANISIR